MATSTTELILKFRGDSGDLKSTMAQVRRELNQTAQVQTATNRGELSMKQQLAAAASLQRQRSAALIAQWKEQERAASRLASGIQPVSHNLQRITDAMQGLRASTATLEGPLGGIAGRLGSIGTLATEAGSGVGGATAALGGLAAAAVGGEVALFKLQATLFNLAKAAAEWRGALFDSSQQLGISTETLSAFEILAKTTGSDLGAVSAALGIFQRNLEDAQDPTSKEAKLLAQLGIEANNTEDALRQTLTRLAAMPEGFHQTATALELFGRGGKSILAILKEMDGDLDGAIARFRELGLIVSREDAKAADEFNDQLAILQFQFRALLGKDGIPAASQALKDLSQFLKDNKSAFDAINFAAGVTTTLFGGELSRSLQVVGALWRQMEAPMIVAAELYERIGRASGLIKPVDFAAAVAGVGGSGKAALGFTDVSEIVGAGIFRTKGSGVGAGARGADPLAAQQRLELLHLQSILANIAEEERVTERSLKNRQILFEEYAAAVEVSEAQRHMAVVGGLLEEGKAAQQLRDPLQKQIQLKEIDNRLTEENNRHLAAKDKLADARAKVQEQLTEFLKEQNEAVEEAINGAKGQIAATEAAIEAMEREGVIISELEKHHIRMRAALLANVEALKMYIEQAERMEAVQVPGISREGLSDDQVGLQAGAAANAQLGLPPDFTSEMIVAAHAAQDAFLGLGVAMSETMGLSVQTGQIVGDVLGGAFSQLAQGVGQAVEAFVLFGKVEGGLRKFAAQMIAQIASMAAVQAVYQLAQGLAWLALNFFFPNPAYAKAAATAFTSAAVFGSIAGVAAVAGRAVAGNEFNKTSGGGGGGTGSGSRTGDTRAPAAAPKASDVDRRSFNTPQNIVHTLEFRVKGDAVVDHFIRDYDLNGRTRIKIQSDGQG